MTTLTAGTRLGPYEILAPLGAGGMGEVYRARDTRLGREVAIKVLPGEIAGDASRLKRFEKEARAASGLNHPNIVTIYDIGSSDGQSWIAMELVEGRTLRELLVEGALPPKRLLPIGTQVAEGLAQAHEAGIVHRDLKPENVMVTKEGRVKILDFGLAKLTGPVSGSDSDSKLPTQTGTSPGVILGTVSYMSPEQAAGQQVDFRSDQFSFGSVLYEMATGKRAFQRGTALQTLTAIVQEEPEPIARLNPKVPALLRWIIEQCLTKEPRGRYASTEDLARDLARVRDHLHEISLSGEGIVAAPVPSRRRLAYVVAVVALLALLGGVLSLSRRTGERPVPSFQRLTFRRGAVFDARFTSDGQTVLYDAMWEGNPGEVFATRLGSREARSLVSNAGLLAVSSSGEMALLSGWESRGPQRLGTLAQAPLAGGAPRELATNIWNADWSPDGSALAVTRFLPEKVADRLEFPLGKPLHESRSHIGQPRFSPRGDLIAFLERPDWSQSGSVAVVDRAGKKSTLSTGWSSVVGLAWSATGEEVWFTGSKGAVLDQGIHAVTLSGKERTVARWGGFWGLSDIARDGRLLAVRANLRMSLVGLAPGETRERDLSWFDVSEVADLSADGKTMLFVELEAAGAKDVTYIRATGGSPALRLGEGTPLALSPDASLALTIQRAAVPGQVQSGLEPSLIVMPTKAGEQRVLPRGAIQEYGEAVFFPDNKRILVQGREKDRFRTYIQDLDGTPPRAFSPEGVLAAAVSPDGRRVAASYYEQESDQFPAALYVYSADAGEPQHRFPLERGFEPIQWSADGRSVFLRKMDRLITRIDRLDVATGKTGLWLEVPVADPAGVIRRMNTFCMTSDGKSYVYSVWRNLGDLYLVEGLK